MSFYISGFATIAANKTWRYWYKIGNYENHGAQYAMGMPEGATLDGSSNGDLVSFNPEIFLDVASGHITYFIQIENKTGSDTSFALTGGGFA
jgi:hypothetical protein